MESLHRLRTINRIALSQVAIVLCVKESIAVSADDAFNVAVQHVRRRLYAKTPHLGRPLTRHPH